MSIRFLNCGSMRPFFPKVENGITCLLIDTNNGPVLVDTGLGTKDHLAPGRKMRFFTAMMRSSHNLDETAFHQVRQLGYKPEDVRHIIMTHLHLDHAGGLADFPHAKIHLYQPEHDHITNRRTSWEYVREHWAHGPQWVTHTLHEEKWYGFDAIRLREFDPEIWLVPLTGHTPGHAGVAVRHGEGWVLHGGDAVPFNMAVDQAPDWISRLMIGPHVPRIREFIKTHPEVQVVGSHMALDFYEPFP